MKASKTSSGLLPEGKQKMDQDISEQSPMNGLIPVRILNEYVYCPRLAYLMWVQGEFAHNADTVEGRIRHKRVDREKGSMPATAAPPRLKPLRRRKVRRSIPSSRYPFETSLLRPGCLFAPIANSPLRMIAGSEIC